MHRSRNDFEYVCGLISWNTNILLLRPRPRPKSMIRRLLLRYTQDIHNENIKDTHWRYTQAACAIHAHKAHIHSRYTHKTQTHARYTQNTHNTYTRLDTHYTKYKTHTAHTNNQANIPMKHTRHTHTINSDCPGRLKGYILVITS